MLLQPNPVCLQQPGQHLIVQLVHGFYHVMMDMISR